MADPHCRQRMQVGAAAGAAFAFVRCPEGSYEAQFRDDTVLQAVCALPNKLREVVLLYYFQELSTPEIAKMLHLPRNVITARLSRARTRLKTDLKGWYFDEPAETASE